MIISLVLLERVDIRVVIHPPITERELNMVIIMSRKTGLIHLMVHFDLAQIRHIVVNGSIMTSMHILKDITGKRKVRNKLNIDGENMFEI